MSHDLAARMRALYTGDFGETWDRIEREASSTYWEENAVLGRQDTYRGLLARLQPIAGRRVLDAGCGRGLLARRLAWEGARVTAVDVLAHRVLEPRGRREGGRPSFVVADFRDLLGSPESFDDIVLQEVLEDYGPDETLDTLRVLATSGVPRIHLVFRQPGRWRGVLEPLLPEALVPTLDFVSVLRTVHVHTPYRLSRQESIKRRSYDVRSVELTLQPEISGSNLY
jgi:SAM-dependent methyltransferase